MCGKCDFIFSLLNAMPVAFLNGWMSWILPHPLQEADGRMDPSSREEIHSGHAEASEGQGLVERTEEISDVHDCLSIQEMLIDCWIAGIMSFSTWSVQMLLSVKMRVLH